MGGPDLRNIEFLKQNIKLNSINNIFHLEQGAISNKEEKNLYYPLKLKAFGLRENKKNSHSITVQNMILEIFKK